jgi:hypothetical protein
MHTRFERPVHQQLFFGGGGHSLGIVLGNGYVEDRRKERITLIDVRETDLYRTSIELAEDPV